MLCLFVKIVGKRILKETNFIIHVCSTSLLRRCID
uniref:Uncharacterized protein n=1 Tax=Vitis vinifera TaxID=29760 RepID=F6HIP5_VITVI